jgi:hypothetical protein
MKFGIIAFFFLFFYLGAFSQESIIGDDYLIKFENNDGSKRIIDSANEFCFTITLENLSSLAGKKSYTQLVWDDTVSRFANYYWVLYKKIDSGFVWIPPPRVSSSLGYIWSDLHMNYGDKGDSIFAVYDLEKSNLLPLTKRRLCFSLLRDKNHFDSGEYKFRIFFRIGNAYSIEKGKREISDLYYVASAWYYFKVPRIIKYLSKSITQKDCDCGNMDGKDKY